MDTTTPGAAAEPARPQSQPQPARIMWVTPARIAYRSLFGRPGTRTFGAWLLYVALDQPFDIALGDAAPARRRIALVPPYLPHRVATPDRSLVQLLFEAETIGAEHELAALLDTPARAGETRRRILDGFDRPLPDASAFDAHFLGTTLTARAIEPRIARIIEQLASAAGASVTAEEWAAQIGVSLSHFTHVFTEKTGCAFRRLRAWKRARSLMLSVGSRASLVEIALDTGYADSTHFSHAIRQFYGYKPSDIFAGSRRLSVIADWARPSVAA